MLRVLLHLNKVRTKMFDNFPSDCRLKEEAKDDISPGGNNLFSHFRHFFWRLREGTINRKYLLVEIFHSDVDIRL